MDEDLKTHWEHIYATKPFETMSWYQPYPGISMEIIQALSISPDAAMIDVGGGDGFLVDALLKKAFSNITVLDISSNALNRAKNRLGARAEKVNWITSNVKEFKTEKCFDFWHDRAAFHFLKEPEDVEKYVEVASLAIRSGGYLVVGTFSEEGPQKCSGLPIQQYSEQKLEKAFSSFFECVKFIQHKHQTPSGRVQDFLFAVMKRI